MINFNPNAFIPIITATTYSGCVDISILEPVHTTFPLYSIDVGYNDGSYQQISNVVGWKEVNEGEYPYTMDIKIFEDDYYAKTTRIHYVTSVTKIEEYEIEVVLTEDQYGTLTHW